MEKKQIFTTHKTKRKAHQNEEQLNQSRHNEPLNPSNEIEIPKSAQEDQNEASDREIDNSLSENKKKLNERSFMKKIRKLIEKLKGVLSEELDSKISKETIRQFSENYFIDLFKKGLNDDRFDHLQSKTVVNEINLVIERKLIEEKKSCMICFEETNFETRHFLKCGHFFHIECLELWLRQKSTCPSCRISLPGNYISCNLKKEEHEDEESDFSEIVIEEGASEDVLDLIPRRSVVHVIPGSHGINPIRSSMPYPTEISNDFFDNFVFVTVLYFLTYTLLKAFGIVKYVFI